MFIVALFTMAKLWNQPKSPPMKNGYNGVLFSHKKNEIVSFSGEKMGLLIIM
jgi:hypothetical protein